MRISKRLNRFYHALIDEAHELSPETVTIPNLVEILPDGRELPLRFDISRDIQSPEDLKTLLKICNLDYPIDERRSCGKTSTKDIETKDLLAHIEYVIEFCAKNGIPLSCVEEGWGEIVSAARSPVNRYRDLSQNRSQI